MERCIFHVDVNSAFLSWSAVKRLEEDPDAVDLRTIPSAVGGDVETRHGIITAKSIPAKKYGVTTGEPVVKALQKCPDLVMVKSDFATYRKYSHALMDILRSYTDLVEQASIDEAYMDVTELVAWPEPGEQNRSAKTSDENEHSRSAKASDENEHSRSAKTVDGEDQRLSVAAPDADAAMRARAILLAEKLKDRVRTELKFTVNVGISVNKILAKTASDFKKPDLVHTLFPNEIEAKMWPMPIGDLHGCGGSTASRLVNMGIRTIGDAANADLAVLQSVLGQKGGLYIKRSANGLGSSTVHAEREEAKGYSNETTTSHDITRDNWQADAPPIVSHLAEKVAKRMQRDGVFASTIGVSVKTTDFRRRSKQCKLDASTNDIGTIERYAQKLLEELLTGREGIFFAGARDPPDRRFRDEP
ncbi:MAG: DNA polymerase IV [Eubacterium sp.]|nr:DNA polymerase IV [Eubacterium sp.]